MFSLKQRLIKDVIVSYKHMGRMESWGRGIGKEGKGIQNGVLFKLKDNNGTRTNE